MTARSQPEALRVPVRQWGLGPPRGFASEVAGSPWEGCLLILALGEAGSQLRDFRLCSLASLSLVSSSIKER